MSPDPVTIAREMRAHARAVDLALLAHGYPVEELPGCAISSDELASLRTPRHARADSAFAPQ